MNANSPMLAEGTMMWALRRNLVSAIARANVRFLHDRLCFAARRSPRLLSSAAGKRVPASSRTAILLPPPGLVGSNGSSGTLRSLGPLGRALAERRLASVVSLQSSTWSNTCNVAVILQQRSCH